MTILPRLLLLLCFTQIFIISSVFSAENTGIIVDQNQKKFDTGQNPKEEITKAETLLFLVNHFIALKLPSVLEYSFVGKGKILDDYFDKFTLNVRNDGKKVIVTATHKKALEEIELKPVFNPSNNPVILYFLEEDIKEMQKLTGGQPNYFRKRIRTALAEGPKIITEPGEYRGRSVKVQTFSITPYKTDPLRFGAKRTKYNRYSKKIYKFFLSEGVPGQLLKIETRIPKRKKNEDSDEYYAITNLMLK